MSEPRQALIIGQPNVGKTLFMLQFAAYCGLQQALLSVAEPQATKGSAAGVPLAWSQARRQLVSSMPNETRRLQSLDFQLPRRKLQKKISLWDSTGLTDSIHQIPQVRLAMAQTLQALRRAHIVLHLLDAHRIGDEGETAIGTIDRQIAVYAPLRGAYAICANKMDLPGARRGLRHIRRTFSGQKIFPISALQSTGFRGVQAFVWQQL